ncbi:Trichothecene 3-O-acetyltransferase [Cytospora mali]|uniref:Trichothecene 3-O-acetyltransferase n=1 Tax=Cytospora mali TaxID=578113 RepID=A0A194VG36_CYTMA|nr:Trichothecene 3-O-acetyltransferase [Valsa mali var. pyri (nom. inval.)]
MGSFASRIVLGRDANLPALTPLEWIGPKSYPRYLFLFELPDNYDMIEVARILKAGLKAAQKRLPVMACEAVPDHKSKQAGVMRLKKIRDNTFDFITFKDLRAPGAFPVTYRELKEKNFPVSFFDEDKLCRLSSPFPNFDERLPVSMVQVNFVDGGMIMTWCLLHMFGDGKTYNVWLQVWAEECRRAAGLSIPNPYHMPKAMWKDRKRIMKPSGRNAGRLEDHPEYVISPTKPTGAPPKMRSKSHRGQVFYFSPQALQELKAEASPAKATMPGDQKWISTNDALSALLWRTVMTVQHPLEKLEGDPVSYFDIAIDGRLRTSPPVHSHTLGCWLEYVDVSMPLRELLTMASLADIAMLVRKGIDRANRDGAYTDELVAMIKKLDDVDRLVITSLLDMPGTNCMLTSWKDFALYDIDWGYKLGGNIQAVRGHSVGVINGLQVVLPELPDGGLEVLVGVEESCLERLMNEPMWNRFAVAR